MASRKPYHHGALRQALLDRALHDLEEAGLDGVSLRALAESAGVSKTAPYRHFADKRALLVAVAADGFRLLAEALEAVAGEGASNGAGNGASAVAPLEGLRLLMRAYLAFARARKELYKLMFSRLGYELHSEECRRNSERALSSLARAVGAAQAAGWRAGQDTEALVLTLWAGVHGWALLLIDDLLPPGTKVGAKELPRYVEALLE